MEWGSTPKQSSELRSFIRLFARMNERDGFYCLESLSAWQAATEPNKPAHWLASEIVWSKVNLHMQAAASRRPSNFNSAHWVRS
jgi:hypothetical protein